MKIVGRAWFHQALTVAVLAAGPAIAWANADLEKLIAAAKLAEKIVGRALPGKVHQAGAEIRRTSSSSAAQT